MIKLLKHHRFQIPNGLAIVAATVLVISSIIGFEAKQEVHSANDANVHVVQTDSIGTDSIGTDSIGNATEQKSRRFNIGSLLFRRK